MGILKIFGKKIVKIEEYDKARDNQEDRMKLVLEKDEFKKENESLKWVINSLKEGKKEGIISTDIGDPTPKEGDKRKVYVAKVAGLYKDLLEPKLKHMISRAHILIEEETNSKEVDLTLKGAIYSFRELLLWGERMVNEQIANQVEGSSEEDVTK